MTRLIRIDQDLSGRTLDASALPDGHARQSLLLRCNLEGASILGDVRGSDILFCTGAADFSQADTYACYWRGRGDDLAGTRFPDVGHLHHDVVREILRQRKEVIAPLIPPAWRPKARQAVEAVRELIRNYLTGSWVPAYQVSLDIGVTPQQFVRLFRLVFEPYPKLAARFEEMVRDTVEGDFTTLGPQSSSATVHWPDGAEVTVDALDLPVLPELSRYALARWIENEAGPVLPGDHSFEERHVFVYSAFPMRLRAMPQADTWLTEPWSGY